MFRYDYAEKRVFFIHVFLLQSDTEDTKIPSFLYNLFKNSFSLIYGYDTLNNNQDFFVQSYLDVLYKNLSLAYYNVLENIKKEIKKNMSPLEISEMFKKRMSEIANENMGDHRPLSLKLSRDQLDLLIEIFKKIRNEIQSVINAGNIVNRNLQVPNKLEMRGNFISRGRNAIMKDLGKVEFDIGNERTVKKQEARKKIIDEKVSEIRNQRRSESQERNIQTKNETETSPENMMDVVQNNES